MDFSNFTKKQHLTAQQLATVRAIAGIYKLPKQKFVDEVKQLNPENREPCNGVPPVLKFPDSPHDSINELCVSDITIKFMKQLIHFKEFKKTELWDIYCAFRNNGISYVPTSFAFAGEIYVMLEIDFVPYDACIKLRIDRANDLYFQPLTIFMDGESLEDLYDK